MKERSTYRTVLFVQVAVLSVGGVGLQQAQAQSDWDLYAMQLINRARTDPAGENARLGTSYSHAPVSPLAYHLTLQQAAAGHNNWMFQNLGNNDLNKTEAPRSFSHFQTDNGQASGNALTGSPGFTGKGVHDRIAAAGFTGATQTRENAAFESLGLLSAPNAARIENYHQMFWNSPGHRNNIMSANSRLFGHTIETRSVTPDSNNNLPWGVSAVSFATQNFSNDPNGPAAYISGLLYDDKDNSGSWTPRASNSSFREGFSNVHYELRDVLTGGIVAFGLTSDAGAFAIPADVGSYHLLFIDPSLPQGVSAVAQIEVYGNWNVDLGTLEASQIAAIPGDINLDGVVDDLDLAILQSQLGSNNGSWLTGDFSFSGTIDLYDAYLLFQNYQQMLALQAVPEPNILFTLLALSGALLIARHPRSPREFRNPLK